MSSATENTSPFRNDTFYITTVHNGSLLTLAKVGKAPPLGMPVSPEFVAAKTRQIQQQFLEDPKHRCAIEAEVSYAKFRCSEGLTMEFDSLYMMRELCRCMREDEKPGSSWLANQNCRPDSLDQGSMDTPVVFIISSLFKFGFSIFEVTLATKDELQRQYCEPNPEHYGADVEAQFAKNIKPCRCPYTMASTLTSYWADQTDICLVSTSGLPCAALTRALGDESLRGVQRLSFADNIYQNSSTDDLAELARALGKHGPLELHIIDTPPELQNDASEIRSNFTEQLLILMLRQNCAVKVSRSRYAAA